ncbi:MAG: hypothetical protein U5M51_11020 [Emticicia sp.]|nr:hypothetical protein [Emticicia sp.]
MLYNAKIFLYFRIMDKPTYQLKESSDGYWYEFDSISDDKVIRKAIGYYESKHDKNAVELVFGDLKTDKLDVTVVSDNKDFIVIINTVIVTVYRFLELYPEKSVSFMGSTSARNRIYRAIIAKLYDESDSEFDIYGLTYENELEKFVPNKDYFSFQIFKKHEKEP